MSKFCRHKTEYTNVTTRSAIDATANVSKVGRVSAYLCSELLANMR